MFKEETIKRISKYSLSALMMLFFTTSKVEAQGELKSTANSDSKKKSEKSESGENSEKEIRNNELKQKAKEIEASNLSPEEKQKMLSELGITNSTLPNKPICFTPKTIPTKLLERFPDMFGADADAYLANVLVLNPAIALDFNLYTENANNDRLQEVSRSYVLDDQTIATWILPNLQLMKKYNHATNQQLVQSIHLFFQHKPELYNFIPIDMRKVLSSESEIEKIIQMQKSLSSKS